MHITVLTLFPGMFSGPFSESIVKRATQRGILGLMTRNIRNFARDKHKMTDDYVFGGGPGMVMKPEPVLGAIEAARSTYPGEPSHTVLLTPQGRSFTQDVAVDLSKKPHVILVCGHYEGVDERIRQHFVNDEVSLGDFVLTGGEPAAIAITDAIVRLLPGVLGDPESAATDSFAQGLLQYPQYTRPRSYQGWDVPQILLSGNHEEIEKWRRYWSILRTFERRPDLIGPAGITPQEIDRARIQIKFEPRETTEGS